MEALLCFIVLTTATSSSLATDALVNTKFGAVKGFVEKAVNGREFFSFKGIPFAEPPVGKLRFKVRIRNPIMDRCWSKIFHGDVNFRIKRVTIAVHQSKYLFFRIQCPFRNLGMENWTPPNLCKNVLNLTWWQNCWKQKQTLLWWAKKTVSTLAFFLLK